jgi:hypothetical protein
MLQSIKSPSPMHDSNTREFRISPEHRRCGWYVIVGGIAYTSIAVLVGIMGLWPPGRAGLAAVASLAMPAFGIALTIVVSTWRLRVDQSGISRRRLWFWDHWPWEEFQSGQIIRRRGGFASATRPVWRSALIFDFLGPDDRRFLLGLTRRYLPAHPPSPGPLPESIELRYHVWRRVTFDRDGLRLTAAGPPTRWHDMAQARLILFEHDLAEIKSIEFDTPERTVVIEAPLKITVPGAAPQSVDPRTIPTAVMDFVAAHVPPGKLVHCALHGPPTTIAECTHRLARMRKMLQTQRWIAVAMPAFIFAIGSAAIAPNLIEGWRGQAGLPIQGWLVALTVIGILTVSMPSLMFWGLAHSARLRTLSEVHELEEWREANL